MHFLAHLVQRTMWAIVITLRPSTDCLSVCLSVCRKLFTFQSSTLKPHGVIGPNLAGMIIGCSSTEFVFLVPIKNPRWPPPHAEISIEPYGNYEKWFFFQKLFDTEESKLAGMFITWPSTELYILVPIGKSTWPPGPMMCSDWLKFQRSSCQKLQSTLNCGVVGIIPRWSFIRFVFFGANQKSKMAAIACRN